MTAHRWLSVLLLAFALVAGAGVALQRQQAAVWRQEIALLRDDNRQLARLRAENGQLAAAQVSAAEVERLRSDHAAIQRLRAEIEGMTSRVEKRARDAVAPVVIPVATPPMETPPPVLRLSLGVATDGGLSLDGNAIDVASVKQRFADLAKGDHVDVRLQMPKPAPGVRLDAIKRSTDAIVDAAKELGLRISVRMESPVFAGGPERGGGSK